MSDKLKAIIVGTGFGCRIQLPALRGAGFDVVAMVGANPARTAERAQVNGVPGAYTDLDEAIAATGADFVAISAPPHEHARLTLIALARGCHVLCEKPFAANRQEAQAMLDAATKAGKVHVIGHELRYDPLRATIAAALAEGMIGEPRFANLTMLFPQLQTQEDDMPDWWFDPAAGGGWFGALGSHVIDQLRCWLGEFESVSAALTNVFATRGAADDAFNVRFRMKNGLEGVLQSSAGTWGPPLDVTRICGNEGTLWLEGDKVLFAGRSGNREIPIAPELALPPMPPLNSDPRHQHGRWQVLVPIELQPYTAFCLGIKAAIEGKSAPSPIVPANFADGVACMAVMDAIHASARAGGALVMV
jgi:predicted dehydrogenase